MGEERRTKLEIILDGVDRTMSGVFESLVDKSDKSMEQLCRLQELEEQLQDFTSKLRRMAIEAECRKHGHDWPLWGKTCRRCRVSKPPEGCLLVTEDEVLRRGKG